jgi:hypothetical protein
VAETIASDEVWSRKPSLAWRRVDDEGVVLDAASRVLRGMNLTGWRVWELLDGERSVEAIADDIASQFDLTRPRALADVVTFLGSLRGADLIERVG